jgi:hypothetical protein
MIQINATKNGTLHYSINFYQNACCMSIACDVFSAENDTLNRLRLFLLFLVVPYCLDRANSGDRMFPEQQ